MFFFLQIMLFINILSYTSVPNGANNLLRGGLYLLRY